ncbi:MAG: nicotinate-nicotinamide nucleotide adenylyltransferase [Cryobacterium sp.]|nr:nicotinate-nicotinamide nucleotide adenylyltransferase [Oligoflexia bacterium]
MTSAPFPIRWDEVTAVFGGTFDPPHLGHREAVMGLFKHPGVREVLILPSGKPAQKSAQTSAKDRLEMVKRNFAGIVNPSGRPVQIDEREIRRPTTAFTIDALREIRGERGIGNDRVAPLAFVIGVDQLEKFESWQGFPDVLGLAHWIVLERAPKGQPRAKKALQHLESLSVIRSAGREGHYQTLPRSGPTTALICVSTGARNVSSTEIRRTFALHGNEMNENASDIRSNLAADVESYLKAHHLYGT